MINRCNMLSGCVKPTYLVIFKGDDTNFPGNQEIEIVIDTEMDLTGLKAHFRFMDFTQDFNEIPENKKLNIVIPHDKTSAFPIGASDATLFLEDQSGKIRTVSNRIHVVVTNSVHEAYENEDTQSVTVTVKGTVTWDMIEDKPTIPPAVTIDPTLTEQGAAADAKAVGDALAGKRGLTDLAVHYPAASVGIEKWNAVVVPKGTSESYDAVLPWSDEFQIWIDTESQTPIGRCGVTVAEGGGFVFQDTGGDFPFSASGDSVDDGFFVITLTSVAWPQDSLAKVSELPTVPTAYTSTPSMDGVGSAGSSGAWSRGDHVHPSDDSKLDGVAAFPAWEATHQYEDGDTVSYGGGLWFADGTPNLGDGPGVDPAWNKTSIETYLSLKQDKLTSAQIGYINAVPSKADMAVPSAAGNLASLTATGNLADSGVKPSDFAAKADLPYRLVEPGVWKFSDGGTHTISAPYENYGRWVYELDGQGYDSIETFSTEADALAALSLTFGTTEGTITATRASLPGHLLDRAVNNVAASSATVFTLPASVPGYARDLLLRLVLSGSSVPSISFAAPTGETIAYEYDGDGFPVPDETGTWWYSFTEGAPGGGVFAVALKKVNTVTQQGGS